MCVKFLNENKLFFKSSWPLHEYITNEMIRWVALSCLSYLVGLQRDEIKWVDHYLTETV